MSATTAPQHSGQKSIHRVAGYGLSIVTFLAFASPAFAASLDLSPATHTAAVNETFDVDINLALDGESVKGVDALLTFNSANLQVVSISNGSVFAEIVKNFNNTDGSLSVSATSLTPVTADGALATVTLKAKAAGSSPLSFDYTSGSKIDSNVLENGTNADLLSSVTNGTYTITDATATTSASPSPTPSLGIGGGGEATPAPTPQLPQAGHAETSVAILTLGFGLIAAGWLVQLISALRPSGSTTSSRRQ